MNQTYAIQLVNKLPDFDMHWTDEQKARWFDAYWSLWELAEFRNRPKD